MSNQQYSPPSAEALREYFRQLRVEQGVTGSVLARWTYVAGSQAVRRWTAKTNPSKMSGAVLFALLAHELNPEFAARIEEAMRKLGAEIDKKTENEP